MKTLGLKMVTLFFLMVGGIAAMGQQDRQEVPGDYFSLEGALELFKQSASPEEFERLLNSANSKVNNLDMNGDGEVDYVRVIDRNQGNVHLFILQAVISQDESQDVAVISLEKLANGKAVLQITGDEDVYGMETIIEPTQEVRVNAGTTTQRTVVNVWAWPSVQYVYSPYYTGWVSPWHWHMRPVWWYSWGPIGYYDYYSYWNPYRPYYSRCYSHRVVYAHHYRPYRTSSPVYYKRHHSQIAHYRSTNRDDRSNRREYNNDDRNRRTNYTDDRTSRSRYDAGNTDRNNTAKRTPTVRERTNADLQRGDIRTQERKPTVDRTERSEVNTERTQERKPTVDRTKRSPVNTQRTYERKESVERKTTVKRSVPVYRNSAETRTKPMVTQRNTQPRNERSTVNTSRGSQQREVRSVDRSSGNNKPSGGGSRSSSGAGRGKRSE